VKHSDPREGLELPGRLGCREDPRSQSYIRLTFPLIARRGNVVGESLPSSASPPPGLTCGAEREQVSPAGGEADTPQTHLLKVSWLLTLFVVIPACRGRVAGCRLVVGPYAQGRCNRR